MRTDMYTIKFYGQNADSGRMGKVQFENNKTVALPPNKYKRKGYKFIGWAVKRQGVISMDHLTINKVKYKNKQKVKNLAKNGETIKLYACWKGYGAEAAAKWARLIAKDNSFMYGIGKRAHHNGCYFCGTNITGPKKAVEGSEWEKTYCCNPFVYAAFTHGANLFKECINSGLSIKWWLARTANGKPIFKKLGRNVKYTSLNVGDVLIKNKKHIKIFVGFDKKGRPQVAHAAQEGWTKDSIRVDTLKPNGRIGIFYVALKYIGR